MFSVLEIGVFILQFYVCIQISMVQGSKMNKKDNYGCVQTIIEVVVLIYN